MALGGPSTDRVARSGSGRKADMRVQCPLMTCSGPNRRAFRSVLRPLQDNRTGRKPGGLLDKMLHLGSSSVLAEL